MAARCRACGEVCLPPRALCPNCYHSSMEWTELSGEGVLAGFTFISVGLPVMAQAGFTREKPYCTGVIQLKEGLSICAQVIGYDPAHPETIRVGLPLRAAFIRSENADRVVLAFEPR